MELKLKGKQENHCLFFRVVRYNKDDTVMFDIECLKGTYIRSLCHDMVRSGGAMSFGKDEIRIFDIENSHTLEEIDIRVSDGTISDVLINIDKCLKEFKAIYLKDKEGLIFLNGGFIKFTDDIGSMQKLYQYMMKIKILLVLGI